MKQPIVTSLALWLVARLAIFSTLANGYPMIVELAEDSERCIRFSIPEDDDAHLVFVAIPSASYEGVASWDDKHKELEQHFVDQMLKLTKGSKHSTLPRRFSGEPSASVRGIMNDFIEDMGDDPKSGCTVRLSNPQGSASRNMDAYWFTPSVTNNVRKAVRSRNSDGRNPLEGYSVCFRNENEEDQADFIVDYVTTSDVRGMEEDESDPGFDSTHLTPLAEQLQHGIDAAKTVIKEMQYMEKREQRMRQTADNINARVRYFSYISVAILLVVTFVQVTYLKRYFRKKKLL